MELSLSVQGYEVSVTPPDVLPSLSSGNKLPLPSSGLSLDVLFLFRSFYSPGRYAPFLVTEDQAHQHFRKWTTELWLTPADFAETVSLSSFLLLNFSSSLFEDLTFFMFNTFIL